MESFKSNLSSSLFCLNLKKKTKINISSGMFCCHFNLKKMPSCTINPSRVGQSPRLIALKNWKKYFTRILTTISESILCQNLIYVGLIWCSDLELRLGTSLQNTCFSLQVTTKQHVRICLIFVERRRPFLRLDIIRGSICSCFCLDMLLGNKHSFFLFRIQGTYYNTDDHTASSRRKFGIFL